MERDLGGAEGEGNFSVTCTALVAKLDFKFKVQCHGDCWFNNMLFRHDDSTGAPVSVTLLDLALSKWCSPAWDLVYFFYTSTTPELREESGADLLKTYHDELSRVLSQLGVDFNYTFE